MKKITTILSFTLLSILSGCSAILYELEKSNKQKDFVLKKIDKKISCEKKHDLILIGGGREDQENFILFLDELRKKYRLNFADKIILWSLFQIQSRPDQSSPQARIDFFMLNQKTNKYYSFSGQDKDNYPFLESLLFIAKKYHSHHSVLKLSEIIDRYFYQSFRVSKSLADFLKEHKQTIQHSSLLKKLYIRGDETLKQGEGIKRLSLKKSIAPLLERLKKSQFNDQLNFFTKSDYLTSACNYEMKNYQNFVFQIKEKSIKAHSFGIKWKDQTFMASSNLTFNHQFIREDFPFFSGTSFNASSALCSFSWKDQRGSPLLLISSFGRDPGQHLYNLLEYAPQDLKEIKDLKKMLNFSRHLILKNPLRLILETQRSTKTQLNELLKLDIPIYSAEKLGKVWAYMQVQNNASFILDERREGYISCR